MASSEMAKAEYADMIKTVSGALTKINKKSPHAADQKMVLATHRVAESTNPNCSRIYLRGIGAVTRNTPVSDHEIEIRTLFTERLEWVNARAKNLSTLSQDQVAYLTQKDQPGGAKTWKSYLWKLAKAAVTGE